MFKNGEKPRFKLLPHSKFWCYDDGEIFMSSKNLPTLYTRYLEYKEYPSSFKSVILRDAYQEIKEVAFMLDSACKEII